MVNLGCPLGKLVDQTHVMLQELTNQLMMFSRLHCYPIPQWRPLKREKNYNTML